MIAAISGFGSSPAEERVRDPASASRLDPFLILCARAVGGRGRGGHEPEARDRDRGPRQALRHLRCGVLADAGRAAAARCSASSAPTAPARPPPSACSWASWCRPRAAPSSPASTARASAPRSSGEVGYLPDDPIFYDYLRGREVLEFVGEMHGLPAAHGAASRGPRLLESAGPRRRRRGVRRQLLHRHEEEAGPGLRADARARRC